MKITNWWVDSDLGSLCCADDILEVMLSSSSGWTLVGRVGVQVI
jgi:hypothetical protein